MFLVRKKLSDAFGNGLSGCLEDERLEMLHLDPGHRQYGDHKESQFAVDAKRNMLKGHHGPNEEEYHAVKSGNGIADRILARRDDPGEACPRRPPPGRRPETTLRRP